MQDPNLEGEQRMSLLSEMMTLESDSVEDSNPSKKMRSCPPNEGYSFISYPLLAGDSDDHAFGFTGWAKDDTEPNVFTNTKVAVKNIIYPMSNSMLHMKVPIGRDGAAKTTFEALVDTGGCSNLAHLPYVKKIVSAFPKLVKQFCSLAECKMEDIKIGGIG
jgi:hypothetical protein